MGPPGAARVAVVVLVALCVASARALSDPPRTSASAPAADSDASPVVRLVSGQVRGARVESRVHTGQHFFSFRGIPYAQPPEGQLRYKAPRPALPWTGVRDATKDGNCCPQLANGNFSGSEDCLNLNVHTPLLSCEVAALPVLVFIHGGGFLLGCGASALLGPDPLVAHNMVVVTLNYRISALGFANLNTADVPGNAGLKDQLQALRWVRDNVRAFCGDPDRVTLAGQGAGAAAVGMLGLTSLSEGLFRAQIEMSGSSIAKGIYTEHNVGRAHALAARLGATRDANNATETEAVLRTASAQDIVVAAWDMAKTSAGWGLTRNPFVASPELRPRQSGAGSGAGGEQEPFVLTQDPESLVQKPPLPRRPTLTGIVSREGMPHCQALQIGPNAEAIRANFSRYLEDSILHLGATTAAQLHLQPRPTAKMLQRLQARVQKQYFSSPDQEFDVRKFTGDAVNLVGDVRTVVPVVQKATHLDSQAAPLFLYVFDVPNANCSATSNRMFGTDLAGVPHRSDLLHLFTQPRAGPGCVQPESFLAKLVANFTTNLNSTWLEDMSKARSRPPYLHIGLHPEIKRDNTLLEEQRLSFWMDALRSLRTPS